MSIQMGPAPRPLGDVIDVPVIASYLASDTGMHYAISMNGVLKYGGDSDYDPQNLFMFIREVEKCERPPRQCAIIVPDFVISENSEVEHEFEPLKAYGFLEYFFMLRGANLVKYSRTDMESNLDAATKALMPVMARDENGQKQTPPIGLVLVTSAVITCFNRFLLLSGGQRG
jgi:hypothetical protein